MLQTRSTALMSQQRRSCFTLRICSQKEEKVNKEKLGKGKLRIQRGEWERTNKREAVEEIQKFESKCKEQLCLPFKSIEVEKTAG